MITMKEKYMEFHLFNKRVWQRASLSLMVGASAGHAMAAKPSVPSEEGYLDELPVVLSVTRLAQSLADTPAAVTIIDRDMIRRSGARQVTDLLRLVPGFRVSGWNGGNAIASYHSQLDETGSRLQVFVDGRSVYSSLYLGDTHRGLSGVVLEDIERIEVLRGSNSAAHGANAFLGVINIVTRNSADTHGRLVSITRGDNGIDDHVVRYGWGNADASYRVTAARRSDRGFDTQIHPSNTNPIPTDNNAVGQLHFRGDLRLSPTDELQVQLGGVNNSSGEGDGSAGNAPRTTELRSSYAYVRLQRELSASEMVNFSASFDEELFKDSYQYSLAPVLIDAGGTSRRHNLEFSRTTQHADNLRSVWGGSWRQEMARSPSLFFENKAFKQAQTRLFGNLEWRLSPRWLLNVGGLFEYHTQVGSNMAPRVMLNWHVNPDHTLRIGATRASRAPSLYERFGDTRFFDQNTGTLLAHTVQAKGNARAETIESREIGYLGEFRTLGLGVDVRIFDERLRGMLAPKGNIEDYVNSVDAEIYGAEYQLNWRPLAGTRLLFGQAHTHVYAEQQPPLSNSAPRLSTSLAWFQTLPAGWDFTLMHFRVGTTSARGVPESVPAYDVTDVRLARSFKIGVTRAEVALVTQAIGGSYLAYISPTPAHPIAPLVPRRSYITLRLEF